MSLSIRAITLDLDDTLWPFAPIGMRIENALQDWFRIHSPATAEHFPIPAMRALRDRVFAENPHLLHDLSALRRLSIEVALRESGGDPRLANDAFETFYIARNQVDLYPDALEGLQRIANRVPVLALSNGNADLRRIGLWPHFHSQLSAREYGAAKPDAGIFHAACKQLDCAPEHVLHVGDHIDMDARGAMNAGLRACWLNREEQHWPSDAPRPDLEFDTLTALADWLESASPN